MTGTPFRFAAPLALLLGLFTIAGCSAADRYGRYGGSGRSGEYGRGGYNYPSSARVGGSGANARYRVCHRGQSRILPAPAVDAHLRHGDSFGHCGNSRGRRNNDRWNDGRRRDRNDDDDRRRRSGRWDNDDDDDDDDRRHRRNNDNDRRRRGNDDDDRRRNRGRWG
jgi:hypothetical protein